ncbi:MAG: hypothetical protein NXI35_30020 [bacterium]|nr:hypothetical protein [bacterium]
MLCVTVGCGSAVEQSPEDSSGATTTPAGSETGAATSTPTSPSPEGTGGSSSTSSGEPPSTSSGAESSGSSTGTCVDVGPTVEPDPDTPDSQCLSNGLDCGCGYRCTHYVPGGDSGVSPWDNSGCFPIHPEPVGIGDPCEHQGDPWSGYDNCPAGSMCEDINRDGVGTCVEFCEPYTDDFECSDPDAVPWIGCQACSCICKSSCDPLGDDCAEGEACYILNNMGHCAPIHPDPGGLGDECEFPNACNPGLGCHYYDGCGPGCCTQYCEVAAPDCPEGTVCESLWEPDVEVATAIEGLGICVPEW